MVKLRPAMHGMAYALVTGGVLCAMLFGAVPSALADDPAPPPNCTTADLEGVRAGVEASTSVYLFTHPDVNAFFTSLAGIPRDKVRSKVKAYLANNPQVQSDLSGIRQPLVDLKTRCGQG